MSPQGCFYAHIVSAAITSTSLLSPIPLLNVNPATNVVIVAIMFAQLVQDCKPEIKYRFGRIFGFSPKRTHRSVSVGLRNKKDEKTKPKPNISRSVSRSVLGETIQIVNTSKGSVVLELAQCDETIVHIVKHRPKALHIPIYLASIYTKPGSG